MNNGLWNLHFQEKVIELSQNVKGNISLIEKTKNFDGFDASGYFVTGKPLMSSFVSNFVTFIIILIQFRTSESTA